MTNRADHVQSVGAGSYKIKPAALRDRTSAFSHRLTDGAPGLIRGGFGIDWAIRRRGWR